MIWSESALRNAGSSTIDLQDLIASPVGVIGVAPCHVYRYVDSSINRAYTCLAVTVILLELLPLVCMHLHQMLEDASNFVLPLKDAVYDAFMLTYFGLDDSCTGLLRVLALKLLLRETRMAVSQELGTMCCSCCMEDRTECSQDAGCCLVVCLLADDKTCTARVLRKR